MGYYLPPYRIFNSDFAKKVLDGRKRLLLKANVIFLGRLYQYPECAKQKLLDEYPDVQAVMTYIPDTGSIDLIDKVYLFNVSLSGYEYTCTELG